LTSNTFVFYYEEAMSTPIHEPIQVGAVFISSGVTPRWFLWRCRRYQIRQITMRWQTQEGRATILHLGVTDGASLFELEFNQHSLTWWLGAVEVA
jgi:hypothetical protein